LSSLCSISLHSMQSPCKNSTQISLQTLPFLRDKLAGSVTQIDKMLQIGLLSSNFAGVSVKSVDTDSGKWFSVLGLGVILSQHGQVFYLGGQLGIASNTKETCHLLFENFSLHF
jgi:hypothetical protein